MEIFRYLTKRFFFFCVLRNKREEVWPSLSGMDSICFDMMDGWMDGWNRRIDGGGM